MTQIIITIELKEGFKPEVTVTETLPPISIDRVDINARAYNRCKAAGLLTLQDIAGKTRQELLWLPQMGKVSVGEIEHILAQHGMKFKDRY